MRLRILTMRAATCLFIVGGGRAKVEVSEAQVYAFVCMMTKKKVDEKRMGELLQIVAQQNKGFNIRVLLCKFPSIFSIFVSKDLNLGHRGPQNFELDVVNSDVEPGAADGIIELDDDDDDEDQAEGRQGQGGGSGEGEGGGRRSRRSSRRSRRSR